MTDTDTQAPGDARCPGPSTRELISADASGAAEPLLEESYEFLGDDDIPFDEYTSADFARAEHDRMWSRVWQWACREEHIPEVGDYQVYDIGDRSALVVRTAPDRIRAFHNFCLHRGTQLKPPGSAGTARQLRCPFHGWTWSLDGQLAEVPCRWDFPHVRDEDFGLPEIRVDTWGGFVFVNFDPEAPPLHEYLGVLPEHFERWPLEDRYVELHVRKRLPANWKAAVEAFLEAYHVLETHPQGLRATGDANAQYDVFGENVSRFVHTIGYPSPHIEDDRPSEDEILQSMMARKNPGEELPTIPDGLRARDVYAAHMQRVLGERYGHDFSHLTVSETIDSIEYFVFPNAFFFPGLQLPMVYRFRPDGHDTDHSVFDLLFLRPKPLDGKCPPPAVPYDLDVDDSYTSAPGMDPGLGGVYDQDTGNMAAQTRGFKGSVKTGQTLGNYQEVRARHLHLRVREYLAR